ncbi:MAG: hypothetical protein ACOZNI_04580 [Myxococcota bacterium]
MPTFVAEEAPAVARLAERAWAAATECAGWEAHAYRRVVISFGDVKGGFHGRAHTAGRTTRFWKDHEGRVVREEVVDPGGLFLIELEDPSPRTVAHEVAHAWVHGGPPALVEGATDLLADCVAERDPARFPASARPGDLAGLVDLRAWGNETEALGGRVAGYAAAQRLFRLTARLAPREHLWRSEWTWDAYFELLSHRGERGAMLRAAIEGGVETQRAALADLDRDGRLGMEEAWGDVAPTPAVTKEVRPGMTPLPPDGTPVCAGVAAGFAGARVRVAAVGEAGVPARATLYAGLSRVEVPERGDVSVPPGASVLVGGAAWARVEGAGLVPDPRCVDGDAWTVVGDAQAEADVEPFAEALAGVLAASESLLGPAEARLVAHLGPAGASWVWSEEVSRERVARARAHGDYAFLAALVEAGRRAERSLAGADPALVEALARAIARAPEGEPWLGGDEADIEGWSEQAVACGWRALLEGTTCPR